MPKEFEKQRTGHPEKLDKSFFSGKTRRSIGAAEAVKLLRSSFNFTLDVVLHELPGVHCPFRLSLAIST